MRPFLYFRKLNSTCLCPFIFCLSFMNASEMQMFVPLNCLSYFLVYFLILKIPAYSTAIPPIFVCSLSSCVLERRVEGQMFSFMSSDAFSSLARFEPLSLLLFSLAPRSSLSTRVQKGSTALADSSISSRPKLVDTQ